MSGSSINVRNFFQNYSKFNEMFYRMIVELKNSYNKAVRLLLGYVSPNSNQLNSLPTKNKHVAYRVRKGLTYKLISCDAVSQTMFNPHIKKLYSSCEGCCIDCNHRIRCANVLNAYSKKVGENHDN